MSYNQRDLFTNNPYPNSFNNNKMMMVSPTYDQHIIKPPKTNVTHGRIPDTEIICSEDRDYTISPEPNNYVVKLKDEYKNVTSISLANASIPNSSYLVNSRNNKIYFFESMCEKLIAEIPEGDYNITDLANEIGNKMTEISIQNNISGSNSTYVAGIDTLTNKFYIESDLKGGDKLFGLCFNGGNEPYNTKTRPVYPKFSMGKLLGYSRRNFLYSEGQVTLMLGSDIIIGNSNTKFTSDFKVGDYIYIEELDQHFTILSIEDNNEMKVDSTALFNVVNVNIVKGNHRSPNKFNLAPDNFIILDIRELENVRSNTTAIDRSFSIIPMTSKQNEYTYICPIGGIPKYIKYFNPPLARLDRLTICFKDKNGNIINFNGIDHLLEFKIHTLNANGKYDSGVFN